MTRRLALLVVMAFLALPALAQGATWQRVADPAPGGTAEYDDGQVQADLAVVGGTPYVVAVTHPDGALGVWRPAASGTSWQRIAGPLNEGPAGGPSIAAAGSTLWLAWSERGQDGVSQARVARIAGSSVREFAPLNRPGTEARSIEVAVYNGRPYVAFNEGTTTPPFSQRLVVARLNRAQTGFEKVTRGLPAGEANGPSLAVSGGRLYVTNGYAILRLNGGGRTWQRVATSSRFVEDISDVNGTLYVVSGVVHRLTAKGRLVPVGGEPLPNVGAVVLAGHAGVPYVAGADSPAPDVNGPPLVAAFIGGAWQPVPSPATENEGAGRIALVNAPDGSLWMLWDSSSNNSVFPPHDVHVARYSG
jgi:hypothetical protein